MAGDTMRALVKRKPTEGIWMEQVPIPKVGTNEVLIKVEKTAICGTDLHIYKWDEWSRRTIQPGLVIGHEFVGRVVAMGPDAIARVTGLDTARLIEDDPLLGHPVRHFEALGGITAIVDADEFRRRIAA